MRYLRPIRFCRLCPSIWQGSSVPDRPPACSRGRRNSPAWPAKVGRQLVTAIPVKISKRRRKRGNRDSAPCAFRHDFHAGREQHLPAPSQTPATASCLQASAPSHMPPQYAPAYWAYDATAAPQSGRRGDAQFPAVFLRAPGNNSAPLCIQDNLCRQQSVLQSSRKLPSGFCIQGRSNSFPAAVRSRFLPTETVQT